MDPSVVELPIRSANQAMTTALPQKNAAGEHLPCSDRLCYVEIPPPQLEISPDEVPPCCHELIPLSTTGRLTHAYERALRNRIKESDLAAGGYYDVGKDLPTFLHDCLMLPGSIASKMNLSSEDVLDQMTPAILPGFHSNIHLETHQPCLSDSRTPGDNVHGMLLFGASKDCDAACKRHYGEDAIRIKARVELDLATSTPEGLKLRRRAMWAYAWVWREHSETAFVPRWVCPESWTIERYVSGTLLPGLHDSMKQSSGGSVGKDYDGDVSENGVEEDE